MTSVAGRMLGRRKKVLNITREEEEKNGATNTEE